MTVTAKHCLIVFLMLPSGFVIAHVVSGGKPPWSVYSFVVWFALCIALMRKLRCPNCGARVMSLGNADILTRKFYRANWLGTIPVRCWNCDHPLSEKAD